jgi:cytochrome c2
MRIATLIAAAALILAVPAQAKMPWVKKSQELGYAEIKDCKACHAVIPAKKGTELTERGKFLVDTKAAKKAAEVDLAWLKDYKGK